jgi:hypothetical protein
MLTLPAVRSVRDSNCDHAERCNSVVYRLGRLRSDMTLEGIAEHAVASAGIYGATTADN